MMMSQVAEALMAEDLNATLHGRDVLMTGVSKDTRDINAGDLYIALVGERFDGHQFVESANAAGAAGALVSELQAETSSLNIPQVQVEDTRIALGQLAAHWRQSWGRQNAHGKLIGITGSNGKTSVKEMCRKILIDFATPDAVLSTKGNLNNDIGMPMMLLELRDKHQYAVIEMGANHVGEIDYLTSIARPDVAIVNNVGPAHLEGFGSLQNIAKGKAEIYRGLPENGTAIINLDDVYSSFWVDYCAELSTEQHSLNVVTFSMSDEEADVYAGPVTADSSSASTQTVDRYQVVVSGERAVLELRVPGKHNVMNALAAIAATQSVGVPLEAAVSSLSDFENIQGRLTIVESKTGYRVIDDSYNANPLSVSAAIDVLAGMPDETVLVLGDMAELGEEAQDLHIEIGAKAKAAGIKRLYATGKFCEGAVNAFAENGFWFQDQKDLIDALNKDLTGNEVVLIKGSRSAAMEKVVEQILTHDKNNKRVD